MIHLAVIALTAAAWLWLPYLGARALWRLTAPLRDLEDHD